MNDPTKWIEGAENWDTDKHYRQRQERGFSDADWINFDTYLAWVIYNGMKKFREDGNHLFPTYEELDCIMDGFGRYAGDGHDEEKLSHALQLFADNFVRFWD